MQYTYVCIYSSSLFRVDEKKRKIKEEEEEEKSELITKRENKTSVMLAR